MKLESLKSPAFESLAPSQMTRIMGGTATAGYRVSLGGREFDCASDCTEINGNGDYYAEFYDGHGCLITTYTYHN